MSIIQSIIGSAVGITVPTSPYPLPGDAYPVSTGGSSATSTRTISGYYEASSLLNTPQLGLYRRTYDGAAFNVGDAGYTLDSNFPGSYTEVESKIDPYVGFGSNGDVAMNFTMQWLGYFKPAVDGNFVFKMNVDDQCIVWVGQEAVSGYSLSNPAMIQTNNMTTTEKMPMLAGKYYPVRIIYTENSGAHNCTFWTGLDGSSMDHNQDSAATGQFFFDTNAAAGGFPGTGLVI